MSTWVKSMFAIVSLLVVLPFWNLACLGPEEIKVVHAHCIDVTSSVWL